MADLLSTSISGLLAFQRALDTTSHNIANANTVGYSRQLTEFMTRDAQQYGNGWLGSGVDVSSIQRVYNDLLAGQSRSASSAYQQFDTFATQAGRLNNLFSSSSTGLSTSLQKFINAFQSVADNPTSTPARQTLLSEAQSLTQRLQSYDSSLRSLDAQVNSQLSSEASTISSLARGIAKLNQEITSAYGQNGQPPNDLMDQRDRLIDQLAEHVNVNVVAQGDGALNVFVGNGQPLVVGQTFGEIVTTPDAYDPTRQVLSFKTATSSVEITNSLSGGSLGGLLDFRSQMLDPARNALGRISAGLAQVVNDQHHAGVDLNGQLGQDLLSVGPVRVRAHSGNGGTGSLSVQRLDDSAAALTTSDYEMVNAGGTWTLRRLDTGATVPMTGSGTSVDPFVADGMSIVVNPGAVTGDRFLIKPTAEAVSGMQVLISDPAKVAAAAPIIAVAASGNTGSGSISAGEVLDAGNTQLRDSVTINFTSATEYTLGSDPTVHTYTPGTDIEMNGWRVRIDGNPAAGDSFTVRSNTSGQGDNRNALKLADVLNQPLFHGGTASLSSAIGEFVGDIGVKTNQAQVSRDAQKVVYDESVDAMQSVSGVNLDEEAANLVRYQQAYLAASQMIRVADTIFQAVLDATRG